MHTCAPPVETLEELLEAHPSINGNFGHLLLLQKDADDGTLSQALRPYFESAHLDARQFETDRVAALAARRAAEFEGPDHRSLETRYGPGSFGCHEALHVTNLVVELLERELAGHSAVLLDAFWYGKVREAQALLRSAYNHLAEAHLAAPLPADEPDSDGSRH